MESKTGLGGRKIDSYRYGKVGLYLKKPVRQQDLEVTLALNTELAADIIK